MKVRQCKQNGCRSLIPYENDYCDAHKALAESKAIIKEQEQKRLESVSQGYRASERHTRYSNSERAKELGHSFYQSVQWRKLSQRIKVRDLYIEAIDNKAYGVNELIVDHIIPRLLAPELAMNDSNMWLLNRKHHNHKTRLEQKMSKEKLINMKKEDWVKLLKD